MLHPRAEGPTSLLEVRPGVAPMVAASAGETGQLLPEGRDHLLPCDDQLAGVPLGQAPRPPQAQDGHGGASPHGVGHVVTVSVSTLCRLHVVSTVCVFIF